MSEQSIWRIENIGQRKALVWDCREHPQDHTDFIEMSGFYTSFILLYGIRNGLLSLKRHPVYPMLRLRPNNTHASFQTDVQEENVPLLTANGVPVSETVQRFVLDGTVRCESVFRAEPTNLSLTRVLFPCVSQQAVAETVTVTNNGATPVTLGATWLGTLILARAIGPMGINRAELYATLSADGHCLQNGENVSLKSGETAVLSLIYEGRTAEKDSAAPAIQSEKALADRLSRVDTLTATMKLDTGNDFLDTMFYFAKLRAGESVFRTANGDVHSPGGGSYYAAVWCNDQVEYAGPWQAYTGDSVQINAAYNAYSWYYPFMDDAYTPIPSSVIAERYDYWDGAGDRGDAAMYLYGASRYALTCGNLGPKGELWRAIRWCAAYCLGQINAQGVVESDSDELEGRLPSGKANLCTNMLTYGGLRYAACIADALNEPQTALQYREAATRLDTACEAYFAADIHGFDTYRYYEGNVTLRSWICMPLCMNIDRHADGTAAAIVSDYLMSEAGQLSEEGTEIAWDRSTLYGLRGMFRVGKQCEAWDYLTRYCAQRLVGRHVPYAVEAWPEGGMRHLSAESALFCQIITEGILGFEPLSFTSFSFNTVIPNELQHLTLSDIHAFGEIFGIHIADNRWSVRTHSGKRYAGICGNRETVRFQ